MVYYNIDGVLCLNCYYILYYKMIIYVNLGKYYCLNCDFKCFELDYWLIDMVWMDNVLVDFVIDGYEYGIEVGGMYNVYNVLVVIVVVEYFNVDFDKIK